MITQQINEEIEYLNSINSRPCSKLVIDADLHKELAKENDLVDNGKYGDLNVEIIDGQGVFLWKLV